MLRHQNLAVMVTVLPTAMQVLSAEATVICVTLWLAPVQLAAVPLVPSAQEALIVLGVFDSPA